jgi:hypothetical protein
LVTALTEALLVPFSYVVEDVSLMVSFWLPAVVSVKPDVDTLLAVPIEPPAAGPDRALAPELAAEDWLLLVVVGRAVLLVLSLPVVVLLLLEVQATIP